MKFLFILLACSCSFATSFSQTNDSPSVGWFLSPEIGAIFHGDHLGKTVGVSFGVKLLQDHLKLGIQTYGRSGPINPKEFTVEASNGQVYNGSSTLSLRGDHGSFGLFLAPSFNLGKVAVDLPIGLGQLAGGFYFTGEDRITPDGDRVSVWENRLMDERDAGFGGWVEFGARAFVPLKNEHLSFGAGLHYTLAPGWETFYDPSGDFYNNRLRFSLVMNFESH